MVLGALSRHSIFQGIHHSNLPYDDMVGVKAKQLKLVICCIVYTQPIMTIHL